MATYIKKSTLTFPDLWESFGMSKDKGGRWETTSKTPQWVVEYLAKYRAPSRAFPNSYASAMLSQKFAKSLTENDPDLAVTLGVASNEALM